MSREEFTELLAKLLSGLQVPRSFDGVVMLGAGLKPYDELMHAVHGFGWTTPDELEIELRYFLHEVFS